MLWRESGAEETVLISPGQMSGRVAGFSCVLHDLVVSGCQCFFRALATR